MKYPFDDNKPPLIIAVDDEYVLLITDGQNFNDPLQTFSIPFALWDSVVEYVDMARKSFGIPNDNKETINPFLVSPKWNEIIPPQ